MFASPTGRLGGEESNLDLPVPKTGVLPLDHPPRAAARSRYYDAPVRAPTVVILAAGRGHPHALDHAEGAAPAVRPADDRCGRSLAAREAGAGRVVVVDGPERRARRRACPTASRSRSRRSRSGTGDAVRAAARRTSTPDAPVLVLSGDVPLITAEAIAALARRTTSSGAAATMATMELDDPRGYGRVVRGADGSVERVVETKAPGDATPEELAIREVNTGIYAFDGGDLARRARRRSTLRQRPGRATTCPTCCRCCAPTAGRSPPTSSPTRRSRSASTTASTSPRVRALAQHRIHDAHALRRRHDRRPGLDADRGRRRRSAATP